MLFAAWLLHSVRLAAALGMAIVAMQAPAVTREYQAALLQLVRSADEDIAQRKASARRFYGIPIENEERFMAELRAVEPSNAETLTGALAREKSLRASYDRIERDPGPVAPDNRRQGCSRRRHRRATPDRANGVREFRAAARSIIRRSYLRACGLVPGLADRRAGDRRLPFPPAPHGDIGSVAVDAAPGAAKNAAVVQLELAPVEEQTSTAHSSARLPSCTLLPLPLFCL